MLEQKRDTRGSLVVLKRDEMRALVDDGRPLAIQPLRRSRDLAACRERVVGAARGAGCSEGDVGRMQLCSGEACTNALIHGRSGEMRIVRTPSTLRVAVSDYGPGIPGPLIPCVSRMKGFSTRKRSLGMGFAVMRELADRVYLSTGTEGTTVLMEFRLSPRG